MLASDQDGVVVGGGGGEATTTNTSAALGVAFYATDEVYEFSAPRFFDFTNEETEEEIRRAELWFETALSYAPSPFMLRIKGGRSFQAGGLCCDFEDMEHSQVSSVNKNSEAEADGNPIESTTAAVAVGTSCIPEDIVPSGSGELHQPKVVNNEESPTEQISESMPAESASTLINDSSSTVSTEKPSDKTVPDMVSIPHASRIAIAQASDAGTPSTPWILSEGAGEVSLKSKTTKKIGSLIRKTSALKPKSQLPPIESTVHNKKSVVKGPGIVEAKTLSSADIAQENQAFKRQKLEGGRTRQIHNVINRALLHKSKPGVICDAGIFTSAIIGHQDKIRKETKRFVSVAEMVKRFQSKTRELEIPQNRTHFHEDAASVIERKPKLTLTRPKGPELETAQRVRAASIKSTAELEEEMLAKIPKFLARPANTKILEAPSLPVRQRTTPQPPKFQEFHLKTMERADHNSRTSTSSSIFSSSIESSFHEHVKLKLTEPKPPHLETSLRARPPKVKTSQELELEELAKVPKFKARPLKRKIIESRGDLGLFCNQKRQVTIPREFHFATNERMGLPAQVVGRFDKLSLHSEPLSERQIPRITVPNPFHFRTEERGVEKERQFSVQLLHELEEDRSRIPKVPSKPAPKECPEPSLPFVLETLVRHEVEIHKTTEEKETVKKVDAHRRDHPLAPPKKERKPLTDIQEFVLHVDRKDTERAEFDEKIKEKETLCKRFREEHETTRMIEEEKAVKQMRKSMVPHARALLNFHNPFHPQKSTEGTKSTSLNVVLRVERGQCRSGSASHMR